MSDEGRDGGVADAERRSKVGRVVAERGLDGLGDELVRSWTGAGEERRSLRELATEFNTQVLRAAMEAAGIQVLQGEARHRYELLTDDDVTGGTRIETERRLEREGVDVDAVLDDFVSHQAVHTYLTKYRDAEAPGEATGDADAAVENGRTTIQQLRDRLRAVTDTSLSTVQSSDGLSLGQFDVYVDVRVTCRDCDSQYAVDELFDRGGCGCAASTDGAE